MLDLFRFLNSAMQAEWDRIIAILSIHNNRNYEVDI